MRGVGVGTRAHILVVDDDPAIREALTAALAGAYVVHATATGDGACALLGRHPVAAIVLDAILGEEHGLDLVQKIRGLSSAPILILTGHGSEDLAARALRARVSDYLKKPVSLAEIREALARLTRKDEPSEDAMARARRTLAESLDRDHTTESLAREIGLSERHLRRQFTAVYGQTPRRYLTEVRMRRAADLLRTTRLGVEQIAQAVGYTHMTTFDRIFKRAFRLTPSAYRQRAEARGAQGQGRTVRAPEGPRGRK
ncbi:MAG TPA: helix-turn-helix domain-containing protein [Candidatus Methylomirabilis sp.]|nr:helix-turn-helix domain-containing protein [Candidatus Methylomirabilis sp.]